MQKSIDFVPKLTETSVASHFLRCYHCVANAAKSEWAKIQGSQPSWSMSSMLTDLVSASAAARRESTDTSPQRAKSETLNGINESN
jgi:hypothetical protein